MQEHLEVHLKKNSRNKTLLTRQMSINLESWKQAVAQQPRLNACDVGNGHSSKPSFWIFFYSGLALKHFGFKGVLMKLFSSCFLSELSFKPEAVVA